ncbi:hypothetical protein [Deinococcus sp. Marseille-Q6407]|uniref:hypothetical protein n=1 Tax=Deinococcus sp. Marseille-Q6407 TaxID=2969223 RepID=UPI0021BEBF75|nr:hypothetical protein [Deinococcus sp. Marseille-Q6407]
MTPKICLVAALALCAAAPASAQALPESLPLPPQWEKEISAAALKFSGQPCAGEYSVDRAAGRFSSAQFAEAAASAKAFTQDLQAFLPGARVRFETDSDHLTRFALLDTVLPLFSQQERRADGVYTLNCSLAPASRRP